MTHPPNEPFGNAEQLASREQRARECSACKGAGEVMLPVWTPDPQDGYERLGSCPKCGGNGGAFPQALESLLYFTEHCLSAADEGVDYSTSREWLDAMTTMGIMEKTGRGKWAPSDQAQSVVTALRAITAALSAQPQSEVVSEPGAIRALVTAANAVLALYPADDGMWTLEQAVRPFNAAKPGECENGCPDNQVCDYCQFAAPQPREVRGDVWGRLEKWLGAYADSIPTAAYHELVSIQRATTPQDAAGVDSAPYCYEVRWIDGVTTYPATLPAFTGNALVTPLYTTPSPGVDVGKLREFVDGLRRDASGGEGYNYTAYEEGRIAEKRHCAHRLAEIIDAAAPGVQAND